MLAFLKHAFSAPLRIGYVTTLHTKRDEIKQLLEGVDLDILPTPFDLPTLETCDLEQLSIYRAKEAFKRFNRPLIIDESAMHLHRQPSPGHLFKYFLQQMGTEAFAEHYQGVQGSLEVVFAYTQDGIQVHTFAGSMKGHIVSPPRLQSAQCGWDTFWVPEGQSHTLSETTELRHIMTHRQFAALNLRSFLFGIRFPGVYEIHVTVAPTGDFTKFQDTCQCLGHGAIDVVNLNSVNRSEHAHQYQTKKYLVAPSAAEATAIAFELGRHLKAAGFQPIRHRVEAMLHSREAPYRDEEARTHFPLTNYFEMHLRILEPVPTPEELSFVIQAGATLSRVGSKMFINAKYYHMGSESAMAKWTAIVNQVHDRGYRTRRIPEEYAVYDDCPTLDADE